jgi:hypothetical protein
VLCVKSMGNPLITFFSIVTWLELFGVSFIVCLGWSGLYLGTLLGRGPVHRIWKQVPLCVLWGLWCERNSRLFEDVEVQVGALCRNVLNMLYPVAEPGFSLRGVKILFFIFIYFYERKKNKVK